MVLCVRHRAGLPCRPALQRRVPEPLSCHKRSVRANVAQAEPSCAEAAPDQEPSSLQQPSSATTGCSFLKTLTIENFALVSNANIQFQPGLNVISGASGSGKSVLLQALAVVLGAAVDKDMVHDQEDKAVVEATFQLAGKQRETASELLEAVGIPRSLRPVSMNGQLVIRREIHLKQATPPPSPSQDSSSNSSDSGSAAAGSVRSAAFINGAATPLRNVKVLGAALVDVNSQNAAAALRSPSAQLALLDRLARCAPQAAEFSRGLARLKHVQERLEELGDFEDGSLRHSEQEMLDRIDALEVMAGEEKALQRALERLNARVGAVQAAVETHATIGARGEERTLLGMLALVARRMANLRQRVDQDPSGHMHDDADDVSQSETALQAAQRESLALLEEAAANLYQVEGLLEGSKGKLEDFVQSLEHDADEYARVKARLHAINDLLVDTETSSTDELLAIAEDTRTLLADWDSVAEELPQLRQEEEGLKKAVVATGVRLSAARRRASGHLRQAVEGSMRQLAMAQSRFDVRIGWEACTGSGNSAATAGGSGSGGGNLGGGDVQSSRMHLPLFVGDEAQTLGEAPGQAFKAWASGLDRVEFLLAAGPAEPLQALRNVASGGESARVMLALKAAPSEAPSAFSGVWDSEGNVSDSNPQPSTSHPTATATATATTATNPHPDVSEDCDGGGDVYELDHASTDMHDVHDTGATGAPHSVLDNASQDRSRRQAIHPDSGVIVIEPPAGGVALYPGSTVHGGAAEFDGDTQAAEQALGVLASPVLVLDEVDAGTGARLGASVAQLLRRLACSSGQVLCVSHVPQVAAYAERHILVEKTMQEDRPHTHFRQLVSRAERVAEVAEMLGLDASVAEDMIDSAEM